MSEPFHRRWSGTLLTLAIIPIAMAGDYCLALAGHPVSLWFWHDILHVIP